MLCRAGRRHSSLRWVLQGVQLSGREKDDLRGIFRGRRKDDSLGASFEDGVRDEVEWVGVSFLGCCRAKMMYR